MLYKANLIPLDEMIVTADTDPSLRDSFRHRSLNKLLAITGNGKKVSSEDGQAPLLGHDFYSHENTQGFFEWWENATSKTSTTLTYERIEHDIWTMAGKIRKEIDKYEMIAGEEVDHLQIKALRTPAGFLSWGAANLCTSSDTRRYNSSQLENGHPDIFQFIILNDNTADIYGMAIGYIVEDQNIQSLLVRQPNAEELTNQGFDPLSVVIQLMQAAVDFAVANNISVIDLPFQETGHLLANNPTMARNIQIIQNRMDQDITYTTEYSLSSTYKTQQVKRTSVDNMQKILTKLSNNDNL